MITVGTNSLYGRIQADELSHKEETASSIGGDKPDISLCGQSEDRHALHVIYRHCTAQETTHTHIIRDTQKSISKCRKKYEKSTY